MNFNTNKEKGNTGLGVAIAYYTSNKTKYGVYQVPLKSCGGTLGKTYKTIINTDIEELFILTGDMSMYIIPKECIKNKTTLNICSKYEKYKVKIS